MLTGAAAVFVVRDMATSLAYYRDALGFDIAFQYGEPCFYACLCRDEVALHLIAANKTKRQTGQSLLCVFVRDVDAHHQELAARGANIVKPPADYDYGMRDYNVIDPDGNELVFGMASKGSAA